jgi:hypothetical protein
MLARAAEANPSCFLDSTLADAETLLIPDYIRLVSITRRTINVLPDVNLHNRQTTLGTLGETVNSAFSNSHHPSPFSVKQSERSSNKYYLRLRIILLLRRGVVKEV